MVYKEALIKVHSFESLKGKSIDNGFTIKDVVIVPADKDKRKLFINNCIVNNQNVNGYLDDKQFKSLEIDITRILKILTSIVKTLRTKLGLEKHEP